jgi:hypothetical protein
VGGEGLTMTKLSALRLLSAIAAGLLTAHVPASLGAAQIQRPKSPAAGERAATWLLAGREGDCAPLSLLEKKGDEFRGIESPEQLAEKMRAAGHKVEVKEHNIASRPATEVRVPERGLYVMFVRAELCAKTEGKDKVPKP